jgi:hypothetical protein
VARKSLRSGPLMRFSLREWDQNKAISPLTCLHTYVERTSSLMSPHSAEHLFIGSTKPHNPVTSSTIRRWIKDQLKETGVDTSVFSAHSTTPLAHDIQATSHVRTAGCICLHTNGMTHDIPEQTSIKIRIFLPSEMYILRMYEIYTFCAFLVCTKELFLVCTHRYRTI